MKPAVHSDAPRRPHQPSQFPRKEIPSSSVFGFLVLVNQYQLLKDSRSAESTSSRQVQDRLIDTRTTRLDRQRAARRDTGQGTITNEGIFHTVPPVRDAQGTCTSKDCVAPVASGICHSFFPNSLSVSAQTFWNRSLVAMYKIRWKLVL